jgi:hypothetical protein
MASNSFRLPRNHSAQALVSSHPHPNPKTALLSSATQEICASPNAAALKKTSDNSRDPSVPSLDRSLLSYLLIQELSPEPAADPHDLRIYRPLVLLLILYPHRRPLKALAATHTQEFQPDQPGKLLNTTKPPRTAAI